MRLRRTAAVAAGLIGLTLLPIPAASPTAAAAPTDIVAVVVDGVGNGHGRGMS